MPDVEHPLMEQIAAHEWAEHHGYPVDHPQRPAIVIAFLAGMAAQQLDEKFRTRQTHPHGGPYR
jgi:hypothetical protein